MDEAPLPPDRLASRLAEVYLVVGPLYRKTARAMEQWQPIMGMSVGVRAVLDQLRRDGDLTVPQMARSQDLSRQFVQRMVNDAAGEGWAELLDNPAHRRSSLVSLTRDGERAIEAVLEREHRLLGQVDGNLTDADIDAALRVLEAMRAGLEDVDDD